MAQIDYVYYVIIYYGKKELFENFENMINYNKERLLDSYM